MSRRLITFLTFVAIAEGAGAQEPQCFPTWSEAVAIVRQENLVDIEKISQLPQLTDDGGAVVKSTLCREPAGRYVYRLVIREFKGQLRFISIDAREPAGR